MDIYLQLLTTVKSLLDNGGDTHWSAWINEDINEWTKNRNCSHHLRAFGGMGSLNDFVLRDTNSLQTTWDNELLFSLTGLTYHFAKNLSFDNLQLKSKAEENISGWRCCNCGHARINKPEIETFISRKSIPTVLKELVKDKMNFDIQDRIKTIREGKDNEALRELIYKSVIENNFDLIELSDWMRACPKCNSKDICAYRWTFNHVDNLKPSKDNIKLRIRV